MIHLLRHYSALVVVISSAMLVFATNMAAGQNSGGFLLGYWGNEDDQFSPLTNRINSQVERKSNLSLVPLAKASTAVDISDDFEDDADGAVLSDNYSFASPVTYAPPPEEEKEEAGVKVYTVMQGDTISAIASRHDITVNTIMWANELENIDSIMPGDQIFILPVSGLTYSIKSGDTLDKIAAEYKADKQQIIAFNELPANGKIEAGQEIVIPGGQKEIPQPQPAASVIARRQYSTSASTGTSSASTTSSGWKKLEGKAGTGHKFPWGYCTYYVSQRRYIPWGGNAGTWLYRAKAMGYKTSRTPTKGAIVVTTDDPYYGHVAIVEKVTKDSIVVSEMNYKGFGVTNTRTISLSSRSIKGYIE